MQQGWTQPEAAAGNHSTGWSQIFQDTETQKMKGHCHTTFVQGITDVSEAKTQDFCFSPPWPLPSAGHLRG